MARWIFCVMMLVAADRANAAAPDPARASVAADTLAADKIVSDSPSNANATVSPTTVTAIAEPATAPFTSNLELSLGTSYASGDFGAAVGTRLSTTALGARYAIGDLRLSASIPYMYLRSNGTFFTGIDSTPLVVAPGVGRRVTAKGVGDLTLGASYTLPQGPTGLELEFSGRVKIPTASRESGLSSRKVDYSAGIQATKSLGRVAPFVSVTYRVFGDPRIIELRDGFAASAGSSFVVDDRTVVLASYHYARAASIHVSDAHELFAGASRSLNDRLRLTGYGTAGLSRGAAGVSGGLSVSLRL